MCLWIEIRLYCSFASAPNAFPSKAFHSQRLNFRHQKMQPLIMYILWAKAKYLVHDYAIMTQICSYASRTCAIIIFKSQPVFYGCNFVSNCEFQWKLLVENEIDGRRLCKLRNFIWQQPTHRQISHAQHKIAWVDLHKTHCTAEKKAKSENTTVKVLSVEGILYIVSSGGLGFGWLEQDSSCAPCRYRNHQRYY